MFCYRNWEILGASIFWIPSFMHNVGYLFLLSAFHTKYLVILFILKKFILHLWSMCHISLWYLASIENIWILFFSEEFGMCLFKFLHLSQNSITSENIVLQFSEFCALLLLFALFIQSIDKISDIWLDLYCRFTVCSEGVCWWTYMLCNSDCVLSLIGYLEASCAINECYFFETWGQVFYLSYSYIPILDFFFI